AATVAAATATTGIQTRAKPKAALATAKPNKQRSAPGLSAFNSQAENHQDEELKGLDMPEKQKHPGQN
ncbi:MAG: hypothetical protein KKD01_10025, partial [Proteobacteria bacterium]|nr:hypothetical protein [Pseudomonadota bacterium]